MDSKKMKHADEIENGKNPDLDSDGAK